MNAVGGGDPKGEADLDRLARAAADGDRVALGELCRELQHPIFRLALRMLSDPHDAEDATQEALVRIVTNLGSFEGRSAFMTWAYAVATRQLLRTRKRAVEASVRGAAAFAAVIDAGIGPEPDDVASEVEFRELCAEVRLTCTYGMLLCLSREVRIVYILGDLMGMADRAGAEVCGIERAAFRQRLARGRRTMRSIFADRCGLIRSDNPCRCARQIVSGERMGILDRRSIRLASLPRSGDAAIETGTIDSAAEQLDMISAIAEVYKSDPTFLAPENLMAGLRRAAPDLLG